MADENIDTFTEDFPADTSASSAASADADNVGEDGEDVINADAEVVETESVGGDFNGNGDGAPDFSSAASGARFASKTNEPDYRQLAQRTAAEFDNYRKRVAKERREWQRDSLAHFLKGFFPAFDDLDRVIAESEKNGAPEAFTVGVKMARTNLWKTLESAGVKEIQAKNKKFDPRYHEAIATAPFPDVPAGNIGDVVQTGYVIEETMLRPARVVVAAEKPKA